MTSPASTPARRRLAVCALAAACVLGIARPGAAAQPARVVFSSDRGTPGRPHVYAMAPDGTGQTALTSGSTLDVDPALSPDGGRVVFVALAGLDRPDTDICVVSADGSGRRRLAGFTEPVLGPAWSPDGRRIAFSTMERLTAPDQDPRVSVWVMDADGRGRKRLADGVMPAWSPDGRRILFTVLGTGGRHEPRLMVVDSGGGLAQAVGTTAASMGAWSPDGRRIAYVGPGEGGQHDLFVMNADGSGAVQLTHTPEAEFGPRWSADGARIYVARLAAGTSGEPRSAIYAVDTDGKNAVALTRGDAANTLSGGIFLLAARALAALQR